MEMCACVPCPVRYARTSDYLRDFVFFRYLFFLHTGSNTLRTTEGPPSRCQFYDWNPPSKPWVRGVLGEFPLAQAPSTGQYMTILQGHRSRLGRRRMGELVDKRAGGPIE